MASIKDLISTPAPDSILGARDITDRARRAGISYFPSPDSWQDEILYFLLPDRFNDGKADQRPLLNRSEIRQLRMADGRPGWDWQKWAQSGMRWQGGTIKGIEQKLDYLQGLGVTALWIAPVLKQRARLDTYHGYGVQDFLDVDPRFGTRQDLLALVESAHARGMRIVLDIILNHSGDCWGYLHWNDTPDKCITGPPYTAWPDFYGNSNGQDTHEWALAWRDETQVGLTTDAHAIATRDQAVWPRELQEPARFTRAGRGALDKGGKDDPHAEFRRTDFFALKDFALDVQPTLTFLIDCYKYWIAVSNIDGYRVDTVKHMELESARNFSGAIREFAETLGKRNFLLISEIAGGEDYQDLYLDQEEISRRNMTAALDIGDARLILQSVAKGLERPGRYFAGFQPLEHPGVGSHRSDGTRHVSINEDHDCVVGEKVRFSTEIPDGYAVKDYQVVVPTAIQLFTLGIPCIYYGTEQAFAGPAQSQIGYLLAEGWKDGNNAGDRYLRETLFGADHPRAHHNRPTSEQLAELDASLPGFGPFGTTGKHCFDTSSPSYVRIAALCDIRKKHLVLRVGRQYLREVRLPYTNGFVFPEPGELVAWSRVLDTLESLCVVNPNALESRGGDVVVDANISPPGTQFEIVANTAHAAAGAAYQGPHPISGLVTVKGRSSPTEPAFVELRDIPKCEALILVRRS